MCGKLNFQLDLLLSFSHRDNLSFFSLVWSLEASKKEKIVKNLPIGYFTAMISE